MHSFYLKVSTRLESAKELSKMEVCRLPCGLRSDGRLEGPAALQLLSLCSYVSSVLALPEGRQLQSLFRAPAERASLVKQAVDSGLWL